MEKPRAIFPCFRLQYNYRWKIFQAIRAIHGKFSIYQHCSIVYMNIHFRKVEQADLTKFPEWYERIGGPRLFSNFIPSTFVSFEESIDLLWYIILDDHDEIGAKGIFLYG